MTHAFSFYFKNDCRPLIVILEPWCEEMTLPLGSDIEITINNDKVHPFITHLTNDYLTIYLWQEGLTRIYIDKIDVTPSFLIELQ